MVMDFCLAALAGTLWLTLSLSLWRRSEKKCTEQNCVKRYVVEKVSCSSVCMQIFAAKVRKPCCLQEFATQKLRPLRACSRNRNHGGRECMKVLIRFFSKVRAHPLNTDVVMHCM